MPSCYHTQAWILTNTAQLMGRMVMSPDTWRNMRSKLVRKPDTDTNTKARRCQASGSNR